MNLRAALGGLCLVLLAFGCTRFSGEAISEPGGSDEASVQGDAASADGGELADDKEPEDAGPSLVPVEDLDGGIEAGLDGCVPVSPVSVVSVAPSAHAVVCNATNARLTDGKVAGLDFKVGGASDYLDGATVTSCIGVDFGSGIQKAFVSMRAVGSACGIPCNGACGTGRTVKLFAGDTASGLKRALPNAGVTGTLRTFAVEIPSGNSGRFIAVCRGGYAAADDDIEVDSIMGCR